MTNTNIRLLTEQRAQTMAKRKRGPKYALGYRFCRQLGTTYAAEGIPLARLVAELERDGFKATGLTVQRVTDAYNEQIARG
jgi:hypothetical protein